MPATPRPATTSNFDSQLAARITRTCSVTCVGLDPVLENLPSDIRARHHEPLAGVLEFCKGVIDATSDLVPIVKPQSACFERFGSAGVRVLKQVCAHARAAGLLVLLDAKRGDIGISAEHYAASAVHAGAHAITVNAYMGPSTVEPYLRAGLGVYVLVRTSNPDSDVVQGAQLRDGRTVAEMMAQHVEALAAKAHAENWASTSVGCVVGATKSSDGAALRAIMPTRTFLVPGFGAQGGTVQDIRALCRKEPPQETAQGPARGTSHTSVGERLALAGVLVNASRSIIYAKPTDTETWRDAVRRATLEMNTQLAAIVR